MTRAAVVAGRWACLAFSLGCWWAVIELVNYALG